MEIPRVLISSGSQDGNLQLPTGDFVEVGSDAWRRWLNNNESFRFESGFAGQDSFTARMHERDGGTYWYAYRKVDGKLRNAYLGKSDRLSVERMLEVAAKLGNGYTSKCITTGLDNKMPNPCITDELEKLKAENARLQRELEEQRSQLEHYKKAYYSLLDDQESTCARLKGGVVDILRNIENKERGYKDNSFNKGIKHLQGLYDRCI